MNTLQAIASILKTESVEWIGCFPSNNLIEAVAQEGIRPLMFRQERGALMAADGFSRLNNRKAFGIVITQGGPGAENAMGGLAQAYGDNVPILYFAGGPALNQRDVRPNFSPVRTYQTVSVSAVTTVLLNNGDMATYPGGYPVAREKFAVTRMTGDYAKIAEGLGAVGIVVKQPAEIAPALAKAQTLNKEGQPVLIDVHSNLEARRSRFDQGGGG